MDPAILKLVLSNVISNAVKHSDAGGEIQLRLEEEGTHLAIENTSQEMVETSEMPMTASRQKKEGGLGLFVVQHLLDHEELAYQLIKQLWACASAWNCPRSHKNKKATIGWLFSIGDFTISSRRFRRLLSQISS